MDVTIWHDPACGTSRDALSLIRHAGIQPTVVEVRKTPPTPDEIMDRVARMGGALADVLREKGTPFADLGLGRPTITDADRLAAIAAHPILLDGPIVATPLGVKLCRPSDVVLDLLPDVSLPDFVEEDGAPALRDHPVAGDDPGLVSALAAAGLPIDDLGEPGRCFFVYATLSGRTVGYAGFEAYGADVLMRSLVVLPEARGNRFGEAILARALRRAFDAGGRRAWTLTTTVADWLAAKGFARVARSDAPASILETRQARSLCPASAVLLTRRIRL
ncbi:MAG: GNAT family N-acetyltransferase [Phyllobacteriaceae bacterium]|nr:GNAT family N-acetyltransferase [Phyllobacteriaceae bacterium]